MQRVNSFWNVDISWPTWILTRFKVKYVFINDSGKADVSGMSYRPHSLFVARPNEITLEQTDRRSVVTIYDGQKTIGEAWLRLAVGWQHNPLKLNHFCETYSYRRGYRDRITAEMDEQPQGRFIVPNREADILCSIWHKKKEISFSNGTFGALLSKSLDS